MSAAPTVEQAQHIGSHGSPHCERERDLFEAYMQAHCWAIGKWLGRHYEDVSTRMLFAVWRDRAALANAPLSFTHHNGAGAAQKAAETLIDACARSGLVLRVDQVPLQPLAMSNYRTVADVYPARLRS